jgi:integrase
MSEKIRDVFEKVPGSGVWWIYWTSQEGQRHREKVGRRGDAITLLSKRKTETLQRKKLPERIQGQVITFGQLVADALTHSRSENEERSTHELGLKFAIMTDEFASRDASKVTKSDIQNWLVEQEDAREWSPATRNRYQAAFSLVFSVAIDNGKIEVNPASLIKRKAENNGRIRFLSPEEETLLTGIIAERYPHYLPSFLISLHTGMRAGEQFNLDWRDVSLTQKRITLAKTKSGKIRHIALNAVALAAFEGLAKKNGKVGYVFLNTEGNRLQNARDWFEPVLEISKLKDYTWHCNRHTFASRLVMAGVDIRTVADLMGHATTQMTMPYAHLAPEHNQSAVDKLVAVSSEQTATAQTSTATRTATGRNGKKREIGKSGIKLVESVA